MSPRTPKYRHHKPSGQAVVTIDGHDYYLGRHGTDASRAEYDRLVAEWLVNGRRMTPPGANGGSSSTGGAGPSDLTVGELILGYVKFADSYYVKDGRPTTEPASIRQSLRPLRKLYGHTPARDFGPLALKAVRQAMIGDGLCRAEVNKRTGRVVRCFKWGVENELVPPSLHHGLKAVSGLRRGRSEAREKAPVKPVPDMFVEALRPHVARQVWVMIELQRLTGMRPGEVCMMRSCDLDTSGRVWAYIPASHKTEHHGKERTVYIGPKAQEVLRTWLRADMTAYLFSPTEAMEENRAARRRERKTPLTPTQRSRKRKPSPGRAPGEVYTTRSYYHAVRAACKKADVPPWHPHQLRHNAATRLRKEFGLDVARVVLGHTSPATTAVYAEADQQKARDVMGQVG